jgi:hypothetical protein
MAKTIEDLFFYLVYLFDALVIIQVLALLLKGIRKFQFWLIGLYCLLNITCNTLPILTDPRKWQYLIFTAFTFFEFGLLATFFYSIISNKIFKKVILLASLFFVSAIAINYNIGKTQKIDAVPIGIETIIILVCSFYYLYEQMNIIDDSLIYSRYHFLMVIGIMVYLGGSLFIYMFANQAKDNVLDSFWFLTYAFYILKNILFLLAIRISIKRLRSISNKPHYEKFSPSLN